MEMGRDARSGAGAGRAAVPSQVQDAPHLHALTPIHHLHHRHPSTPAKSRTMEGKLARISSLAQKDRLPEYQTLVIDVFARPDSASIVPDIHALVDAVQENVVNGRQILSTLAEKLSESKSIAADVKRQIVEDVLSTVQARVVSYEEQASGGLGL